MSGSGSASLRESLESATLACSPACSGVLSDDVLSPTCNSEAGGDGEYQSASLFSIVELAFGSLARASRPPSTATPAMSIAAAFDPFLSSAVSLSSSGLGPGEIGAC